MTNVTENEIRNQYAEEDLQELENSGYSIITLDLGEGYAFEYENGIYTAHTLDYQKAIETSNREEIKEFIKSIYIFEEA